MSFEIILTPKAKDTLLSIVNFIKAEWGQNSAEKFVAKTYQTLHNISMQPYLFKAYSGNDVRIVLIAKQTSVVYRIGSDKIEVLFFWDNRQDPVITG
ncbi:type II toxin-antitoxin system RelE/ParE family toxin [Mucilaginibacter ginsenosidivorans]|uniref:Type II toxin-antitoxin system RelE/ParE family toxin n=1 Tax=Mucilaginibacter ginsenosidivorans TaxID=398053 RepID=A0A5B8UW03_9SPHI|nr:type II toxin-antitoxin system RelE/ParE family toxin [Mucilaginibacter ginsenosidivorans]QEC62616.1 type II toxin-antitoxin system RelE/ParE family toxin [Mucilaginibacter ginsenosidivorans]